MPEPIKFISREIEVTRSEQDGSPTSFTWDGVNYTIREIIATWQDWGFSAGAPSRKTWRMRRHRNFYQVATDDGAVYELYFDRGVKPGGGSWILHCQTA